MKDDFIEYVPLLETHNAGDRVFLKSIQGETVAPYVFNALPMRLMVRKDEADKVREILKGVKLSYSYGIRSNPEDIQDPEES